MLGMIFLILLQKDLSLILQLKLENNMLFLMLKNLILILIFQDLVGPIIKKRRCLNKMESNYKGELDLQGLFNLDPNVRPGYQKISIHFKIQTDTPVEELDKYYRFSPVYDVVNSRLVIPEEREEMCLSIRGKKNRIRRNDFIQLAAHFGLNENRVFSTFERLMTLQPVIEQRIEHSFLPTEYQKRFIRIFRERIERLRNR